MTALPKPLTLAGDTVVEDLQPDLKQAQAFLDLLDPFDQFTFQTFDDDKQRRDAFFAKCKAEGKTPHDPFAKVFHGFLQDHADTLASLNAQGAGVFVTVNSTDLKGRSAANVTRIRGVFVDLDQKNDQAEVMAAASIGDKLPMLVESSPEQFHVYLPTDDDDLTREEFKPLQQAFIRKMGNYGADTGVHDLPRVLRLPGFYHRKGEPYMTRIVHPGDRFTADEIRAELAKHPAPPPAPSSSAPAPSAVGNSDLKGQPMTQAQAQSYLDAIPNTGEGQVYDNWLGVAMAIKQELGNSGLPMFLQWSRQSSKHNDQTAQYKWDSFKGGNTAGAFLGSLAKQCGWRSSAERTADQFKVLTATGTASTDDVFTPPERDYLKVPEAFQKTVIGKLASRVAHCLEFPEASASLALLAGASAAVATSYAIQYASGTPITTGIYSVIEQPPSMRKSELLNLSQLSYLKAMREHNARVLRFNSKQGQDDPKAVKGFVVTTDATTAGLDMEIADCSEGRFFISSAEQAAFQSLFPEKGDFASHNGLLLQGWQGEFASATRKGRKAFSGNANGSVLVIAQPGSSARVFSASNGTGLAERFFYLSEPTPLGTRKLHGEFVSRSEVAPFNTACSACVKDYSHRRLSEDGDIGPPQDPEQLRQLTLTPEGYRLMLETRRKVEPKLGRLAREGEMLQVGWLGKIETHTLKVAAVLHVVESLGNGCNPSAQIPLTTVQTALEYVEMLAEHLTHILHDSGESGEAAEIDAVIDLITSKAKPYQIRPLCQALRKRHPFRAMGKDAYTRARQRVESMIQSKRLLQTHEGEIHPI